MRSPEPLRVVLSRSLALPPHARLWDTGPAPTLVAHGPGAPAEGRESLDRLGVERLELPACEPLALLEALAQRGCNQVFWEPGPELAAAAVRQGCVQEIDAVIAPKLLGGVSAATVLADLGLGHLAEAPRCRPVALERLGADLLWRLRSAPDGADPP
ncbi:MAG: RibD family protein, partial [Synechococcaceae cyanobacterium]|nr:RibD family protein [Synechococcaceae cyanobacterium]